MKKNLLALLLALAMMLTLVACGSKEEPKEDVKEEPSVEEPTIEEKPAEPAPEEKPEEKPAEPAPEEKPEEKPAEPAPEEKPEEKPAEPAPEEKPEEKPAEPAPEEKPEEKPAEPAPEAPAETQGVDLGAFYESVASGTTDWPGMMPLEGEMLDAFYAGLTGIATKQCGVYMPMMSSVVCEIALVEVENAADVQAVKDIFQARINYQVGDDTNPGGAWYPESIEGWKNHSRVVANGNCVMMIAFSGADTIVEAFNALF